MELSKVYLDLKAKAGCNEKCYYILTRPLAEELLTRAEDCRAINPKKARELAISFNNKTFDAKSDVISIFYETDKLHNGVQRLAGFLQSKVTEIELCFVFVPTMNAFDTIDPLAAKQLLGSRKSKGSLDFLKVRSHANKMVSSATKRKG